jgi:hypothetical protein
MGATLANELMRQALRVAVGTAVYVAIVVLAAPLPAAAGIMLTFPALNGLFFFFSGDARAAAIARSMLWMPLINGALCGAYILLFAALASADAATGAAWCLLLAVLVVWYAAVSRRRVRAGIGAGRQLIYALAATLVGALMVVVAVGVWTRAGSGPVLAPGAAAADGAPWIVATILRSKLKIALFAATLAILLLAAAYFPLSDSTRGILSGLPIVPFGGLVAIAADGSISLDGRLAILAGMGRGVWLGPAVAIWFIYGLSRFLSARAKRQPQALDSAIRFGALVAGWLAAFAVIVVLGYAIKTLAA